MKHHDPGILSAGRVYIRCALCGRASTGPNQEAAQAKHAEHPCGPPGYIARHHPEAIDDDEAP